MRRALTFAAVFLAVIASHNLAAQAPTSWRGGEGWEVGVDRVIRHGGSASGYINVADVAAARGFGTLRQSFLPDEYRGKRVRFSAWVKTDELQDNAALWMRVDGEGNKVLSFDNMRDRSIGSRTDWRQYHIVLDVPTGSVSMIIGMMVMGQGRAWMDDVQLEIVGSDVPVTGGRPPAASDDSHGHTPEELEKAKREALERRRTLPKRPLNLDFEG